MKAAILAAPSAVFGIMIDLFQRSAYFAGLAKATGTSPRMPGDFAMVNGARRGWRKAARRQRDIAN
jgi:hypothetical protein